MYCLFFLLFPSFLSSHSDKIITKEIFTESESSAPKTTFNFSSKLIPEKCLLNTFSQMSSIPIHHYLSNLNQTKFISNVTTFPQFNKCIQYEDDLIIEKKTIVPNFDFYLVKCNYDYKSSLGIGLSYKFDDEKFSLVHRLYNGKRIEHKSFGFHSTRHNEAIYFGGIPKEEHLRYNYKGYCNVDNTQSNWGCALHRIQYGNLSFDIKETSIINSASMNLIESKSFYDMFINFILKKEIEDEKCNEII